MAKFFNKKKLVMILASAALGICAVAAAGCKKNVEQISITRTNTPQTTYVLGSDLNLSNGMLTVVIDGVRSDIPLSDPEITISGYDRNTLGEQVLTVQYKEQTTVLKVTVVPRMSVGGYEEAYFVGEPLNKEKGEVTITADNGESTFIALNDATVDVEGFNSSVENSALPLTISYSNGEVDYSTTVDIAIYKVDTIDFVAPSAISYKSHDKDLNVGGGSLTLNSKEGFKRPVSITEDMVSGFNPAAATVEHRENALIQTLTVTYCGYTQTYDVQIKFSDVSLINLRASEMKDLTWNGTEVPVECNETMGDNALDAMQVYLNMSDSDLKLLEEGTIDNILKLATVYGFEKWMTAFETYSDAFYYNESGSLSWDCSDFEKTQAAYQRIQDKDPIMYEDGAILTSIREKFADVVLIEEELTIGEFLAELNSPETIDAFIGQLGLMIDLHNALKDIPKEWTLDMLKSEYADEIYNAWKLLFETEHKATQQRPLYLLMSMWREENDYFDILYTFYYDFYINENANPYPETDPDRVAKYPVKGDLKWINAFKDLRLPGALEDLYSFLLTARSELIYLQQGYRLETTNFMLAYESAIKIRDQILESDDTMLKQLYKALKFDYLIGDGAGNYQQVTFDNLFMQYRRSTYGYVHNFNIYLGIPEYEQLWNEYSALLEKIAMTTQEDFDVMDYAEDIEKLFNGYLALTPKQQFAFMVLLHPRYIPVQGVGRYPAAVWANDGTGYQNQFTYLIYTYYETVLPSETHDIFTQMMLATEAMANYGLVYDVSAFYAYMDEVYTLIERVQKNHKDKWETFMANKSVSDLLFTLESYDDTFRPLEGEALDIDLSTEEERLFGELLNASYEAYWLMAFYDMYGQPLALPFFSVMEKVETLSARILASDNPAVHRYYYFVPLVLEGVLVPEGVVTNFGGMPADVLVYMLREMYIKALTGMSYLTVDTLVYDVYQELDVKEFLSEASYLYFHMVVSQVTPAGELRFPDTETVKQIAEDFRLTLTDEQRYFIFVLDSQYRFYINGMIQFADERNSEMHTLVNQLYMVEMMSVYAAMQPDMVDEQTGRTYLEVLEEEYNILMEDYEVLRNKVNEEKEKSDKLNKGELNKDEVEINEKLLVAMDDFNTYFGEMYAYYIEKCAAMFPAEA